MPPKAAPRRPAARRNITTAPDGASGPTPQNNTPSASGSQSTPTPGPSRPPVQRLQSLNRKTPAGSIAPAAKPPGPAGEQQPKPTLKYKPRAVGRRSKEERDAIEKVEAQRHRERLAEAAAKQRGRGGAGPRGRGGFGRGGRIGGADGPLGSGAGARRGRGGRVGTESRVSSVSRSRTRSVVGGPGGAARDVSSDESDSEVRVNMDQINIESSDEEGEFEGKAPPKKGKIPYRPKREKGLRPVRVEGHEHKERVVSVNMESSSNKSAALREQAQARDAQDNALFVEQESEAQAKEGGPNIKEEPPDDDQPMTDAVPHAEEVVAIDDGPLPEQQVKVRRKLTEKKPEAVEEPDVEEPPIKDPRRLLRTAEEIEEFDRHEHDLDEMKKLFTADEEKPKEPRPEPQPTTEDGEEAAVQEKPHDEEEKPREEEEKLREEEEKPREEEELPKDKLAGHLFLMQFPPMTPNLLAPSVEGEPADTTGQAAPADTTNGNQPEPTPVKRETDGAEVQEVEGPTPAQEQSKVVTATDWQLQAGRVGKMNVHASGRVTVDWGGISFELDRSTGVDFLQEAVIMSEPPTAESEEVGEESKVWSMGQLSGKFTVTPDWEKML
ncbi:hypothetical protein PHISP_07382 [Aspergillus sp. HF37]|nr:hypothetical protein PHISP_07382 [Aspergillus sp. HF37]